jgi:hypothetical protein
MYVLLFQNKKLYATEQFEASASSGASSAGSASGVGGQPPCESLRRYGPNHINPTIFLKVTHINSW